MKTPGSRFPGFIAASACLLAIQFAWIGPATSRTVPADRTGDPRADVAGRIIGDGRMRLAESRDRTIDYRGTYWGDALPSATPPPPSARSRNPLVNFLPDPNAARRYDEWSQQTYFDRSKRLAPTGDEPGIKEKPAVTFLRLRF